MPSNGSRHNDEALGRPGNTSGDPDDRARREGEALSPERGAGDHVGPRVRDLRASRDTGPTAEGGGQAGGGAGRPDISDFADMPGMPDAGIADSEIADAEIVESEIVDAGEMESVVKERDELLDTLRRTMADFDNYRKRVDRQSAELRDRANERMVEALLPALDAFALARAHLGDKEPGPEVRALLAAASLFEDALAKEGLTKLDAEGAPFDPVSHEAVEHVPAGEDDPRATGPNSQGTGADAGSDAAASCAGGPVVIGVLRPGYLWKGRVIRPAMVRVRG